jgi:translocation and assembly module TamA
MLQEYLPEEAGSPHKLELLLSQILATEGYFSPISSSFPRTKARSGSKSMRAHAPGLPSVDVAVDGQIEAKTKANLIADWRLPVGQPFRQADWNEAKQHVLAQLLSPRSRRRQTAR